MYAIMCHIMNDASHTYLMLELNNTSCSWTWIHSMDLFNAHFDLIYSTLTMLSDFQSCRILTVAFFDIATLHQRSQIIQAQSQEASLRVSQEVSLHAPSIPSQTAHPSLRAALNLAANLLGQSHARPLQRSKRNGPKREIWLTWKR